MNELGQYIVFKKNVANIVSILGVLPICILFLENGYQYLLPLIIYNNVMDDLDGVLAAKLNIRSEFGAVLDNVCDAISHSVVVMFVGMHFAQDAGHSILGGICLASSLLATGAMIVRIVTRINPTSATGIGSPTNELVRHVFFVLLVAQVFAFNPAPYLIAAFLLHTVTMLAPFKMPYLIRSLTKSAVAIGLVNVALLVAWMVPYLAPVIAASFIGMFFLSFFIGGAGLLKKVNAEISS